MVHYLYFYVRTVNTDHCGIIEKSLLKFGYKFDSSQEKTNGIDN